MGFSLGAVSSLMSLVDEKLQSEMSEALYVEVCNAMKYLYERKRAEDCGSVRVIRVDEAEELVEESEEEEMGGVSSPRYRERLARIRAGIVRGGLATAHTSVRAPYLARIAAEAGAAASAEGDVEVEVVGEVVASVGDVEVEVVGEVVAPVGAAVVPVRRREEEVNRAISLCRDMLSRISIRVDSRIKTTALREKCVEVGVSPMELSGSVYSNKEVKEMEERLVSKGVGMAVVKALYQTVKKREIEKERARITVRMEALERRRV